MLPPDDRRKSQPFANGDEQVDVTAYVIREGLIRDKPLWR